MKVNDIKNIIKKVYPTIAKDYNSNAKVELHKNIFARLNSIPAENESIALAEYDWNENKIYIYAENIKSLEDIVCSLIHECVHSKQSYDLYIAYKLIGLDYDTHPYEIEASYEENKWKKYI